MVKQKENTKLQVLVTGGTGKTGSRVARKLTQKGVSVRIGSRSGNPPFDWENESTWKAALEGMDAVYIAFQPDLAVPRAVELIGRFTSLAVASGARKLVLLSGRGEKEAERCEELVKQSGVDWTILRCSWFNQNFSESYLLDPIRAGYVSIPAGNVGEPFIDADDIADVAVAALTEEGHINRLYELTGPHLLTFGEAIQEIAKTIGKPLHFEQVPVADYRTVLRQHEVPEEHIELLTYLFSEVLDGRNAGVADGVQQALGREPLDFRQYVARTAAAGTWNSES